MLDIKVTDAMFALLRTVFDDEKTLREEDRATICENIGQIYAISNRCDMAHLFGYAMEKQGIISPENEFFSKFQKQQYLAVYRYEGMKYEIERICFAFERNGIDFILLKGAELRSIYPEPWMRTSSDIDILVKSEDIDRATEVIMAESGYSRATDTLHDRSFFSEGNVHIELHFDLLEEDRANSASEVLCDVWSHSIPAKERKHRYILCDEMFYFYHIAHIAKHVEYAGVGMRPFIDLWLLNHCNNSKSLEKRAELLSRCGLERFANVCEELAEHWLGKRALSETGKKFETFILNCSTYGSEQNRILLIQDNLGGTNRSVWRRICMPSDQIKFAYPILQRHKWLTPVFQVVRWCKLLSGKMAKKAINELKISRSATQEDSRKLKAFMSEIGL